MLLGAALRATAEAAAETGAKAAGEGANEGVLATGEEANTFCALVAENKKGCCCWGALSRLTGCWG